MYVVSISFLFVCASIIAYSIGRFGVLSLNRILSKSFVNPYIWVSYLFLFFIFDFLALSGTLNISIYEEFIDISEHDFESGLFFFCSIYGNVFCWCIYVKTVSNQNRKSLVHY